MVDFAHREGLEQRRVRLLVGFRHHADLSDHALVVDLTRRAVGACPLVHRPAGDALLVGVRHLVVLAVVVEGFLGPRLLDDLERLLVDLAVVVVDRRAVHRRTGHMVLLAEHVDPAILIAAREAGIDAALGEMVEHRELLGGAHRVPRRQHQAERREFYALGARGEVGVEQERRHRRLVALGMEMMLGGRHHVEAGIVGEFRELAQLVEHLLVALVVAPDRAKPLAVFERPGNRRQDEKHELHRFLLLIPSRLSWRSFERRSRGRRAGRRGGRGSCGSSVIPAPGRFKDCRRWSALRQRI